MSCSRQTKTQLNDEKCLVDALKQLGYKPEVNQEKASVRGHGSERLKAEIILKKEDLQDGGDIGFSKQKDGTYTIVRDDYVMRKTKMTDFTKAVTVAYTSAKVRKIAKERQMEFNGTRVVEKNGQNITVMKFRYVGA